MWYEISQNKSGGNFDVDINLCHRLFIEAENIEAAIRKAEQLGCYWDGVESGIDCPCCGDRWVKPYSEIEFPINAINWDRKRIVFTTIEEYAQNLANEFGWTLPDARLFFANGSVKAIEREVPSQAPID